MSLLTGILLGLVHGLTEFLPVSSSGHLALLEHFLPGSTPPPVLRVFLYLSSFLAALIVLKPEVERILAFLASIFGVRLVSLRSDDLREGRRLFVALVVGAVPAVLAGLFLRDRILEMFDNPRFIGFTLLVTGGMLLSTRLVPKGRGSLDATSALVIGIAQAVGLVPGMSRSGMAVSAGLASGLKRERAARFSLLVALPVYVGGVILNVRNMPDVGLAFQALPPLVLGLSFVTAFLASLLAIAILLRVVESGRVSLFGIYCILLGAAALVFIHPA